jgi:molybdopterin biosynthesis enzyme
MGTASIHEGILRITRDDHGRLARRLTQISRSHDLLIRWGGVSDSDADHIVCAAGQPTATRKMRI